MGDSLVDYDTLIAKATERSLDIYIKAARGESEVAEADASRLMKIGALAKAADVTVPTIRFWTSEGLLEVAEVTPSGYQLYSPEMVDRCGRIQKLKSERFTLAEIKSRLG